MGVGRELDMFYILIFQWVCWQILFAFWSEHVFRPGVYNSAVYQILVERERQSNRLSLSLSLSLSLTHTHIHRKTGTQGEGDGMVAQSCKRLQWNWNCLKGLSGWRGGKEVQEKQDVAVQKAWMFTPNPESAQPSVPQPFPGQPEAAAAARARGRTSNPGELSSGAGNAYNHLIAFAGCPDRTEWAVGRLQSAVWQDSPWL